MIKNYLFAFLLFIFYKSNAQVSIPDANFKNALINTKCANTDGSNTYTMDVDTNDDGEISIAEAVAVKALGVGSENINDLKGIEAFVNLEILSCSGNELTALDVSKNTSLTRLYCSHNELTALDMSKNTSLTSLSCGSNKLTTLDFSKNTNLTLLYCNSNQLTTLDVSKNNSLTSLFCGSNKLTTLDVSKNNSLSRLYCVNNELTTLDLSKNNSLTSLFCDKNELNNIDVTLNTKLEGLSVTLKGATELDLRNNPDLKALYCDSKTLRFLYIKSETNFFKGWTNCEEPRYDTYFSLLTPNIEYICGDESDLECIQHHLDEKGYTNCSTGTNCSYSVKEYNDTLEFFPNPVTNLLTINSKQQIESISFIDISGRLIRTVAGNNSLKAELTVSSFLPGTYFIKIKTATTTFTKRMIKK